MRRILPRVAEKRRELSISNVKMTTAEFHDNLLGGFPFIAAVGSSRSCSPVIVVSRRPIVHEHQLAIGRP